MNKKNVNFSLFRLCISNKTVFSHITLKIQFTNKIKLWKQDVSILIKINILGKIRSNINWEIVG